jgi:hypothetical protein
LDKKDAESEEGGMTMKITIVILLAMLASLCSAQCLVVRGKHHERVTAVGDVPFHSHYSERSLRRLDADGVHIVTLSNNERATPGLCDAAPTVKAPSAAPLEMGMWKLKEAPCKP